jgi:hypothetical protein
MVSALPKTVPHFFKINQCGQAAPHVPHASNITTSRLAVTNSALIFLIGERALNSNHEKP